MIRNGYLTHPDADFGLHNLRLKNPFLHELLIAVSMTCLVYQVTKLLLEISLGQTRRGEIKVSDFHIYTVVSSLSFTSILSPIWDRKHQGADAAKVTNCPTYFSSTPNHIISVVKYVLLLMALPGIQILGIFLSIETESSVSFKQASFGGMGMGVSGGRELMKQNTTSDCAKVETFLAMDENAVSDFFRCYNQFLIPFDNEKHFGKSEKFIVILRASPVDIGVTIVVRGKRWISSLHLDMSDGKKSYRLKNVLTGAQREEIFDRGIQKMIGPCPSHTIQNSVDISWVIPPSPQQEIISASVECDNFDSDFIAAVANRMLDNVTFVETERLELTENSNYPLKFKNGEDIVFFERRRSTAMLLPTIISVLVVFLVRHLVMLVLYVEGPLAMEMLLKERFGLNSCDSMLQVEQTVHYGNIYVSENAAQGETITSDDGDKF